MPETGAIAFRDIPVTADFDAVGRLVRATGFFSDAEAAIAEELVAERLEKGAASDYDFLFAEAAGGLRGYACYGPVPGSVHSFDLYWIVVDPAEQGRGLGRALLAAAEQRIARRGGRRIYADTSSRPQYEPTRRFYEACGYRQEAFLTDFYAPSDGKIIFGKHLG